MAHIGVLRVLERERIPIAYIAGVSAGSIVAAGYAGGADSHDLERVARSMSFKDVARWSVSRLGLVGSTRMAAFLQRSLPVHRFEEMKIPLAVVATDLRTGEPVVYRGVGEVFNPVRASCSYPGLFQPVRYEGRLLVDGAISMEIPAAAVKEVGIRRVVSVALPPPTVAQEPGSMFAVVTRCFQIMQRRTETHWRNASDAIITPDVSGVAWDDFSQVSRLIDVGMQAAELAVPQLRLWCRQMQADPALKPATAS
jgi:NTE family protein